MFKRIPAIFLGCVLSTTATARLERHDTAAVVSKDEAWGSAEAKGDDAFVSHLLLPGYRSVGPDGKVTTRETIIAHTGQHRNEPAAAAKVSEWRKAHPSKADVVITGDIAVLTWIATDMTQVRVRSCDIFAYVDGEWRAIYSQHTAI